MDILSRTTIIGAAAAGGGPASLVTENFIDNSQDEFLFRQGYSQTTQIQKLSDGGYITSSASVTGTSSNYGPVFLKYNADGEVQEIKKFYRTQTQTVNFGGVFGHFVYDEGRDTIYFAFSASYSSSISAHNLRIYAINWSTGASVWILDTYHAQYDPSCFCNVYDDGDYLHVEMSRSSSATDRGKRYFNKVRKSDGATFGSRFYNIVDGGTQGAGVNAVDTTNNKRLIFSANNTTTPTTTCRFYSAVTGSTDNLSQSVPSGEFYISTYYTVLDNFNTSSLAVDGDDVYMASRTDATNKIYVWKLNKSTLTVSWAKTYQYSTVSPHTTPPYFYHTDCIVDSNGDVFVSGAGRRMGSQSSNAHGAYVFKIDGSNGNIIYQRFIERNDATTDWNGLNVSPMVIDEDKLVLNMTGDGPSTITGTSGSTLGINFLVRLDLNNPETGNYGDLTITDTTTGHTPTVANVALTANSFTNVMSAGTDFTSTTGACTEEDFTNNADFYTETTDI